MTLSLRISRRPGETPKSGRLASRLSPRAAWSIVGVVLSILWLVWASMHIVATHTARNERYTIAMIASCVADNAKLGTSTDCRADAADNLRYPIGIGAWTILIAGQLIIVAPFWLAAFAVDRALRRRSRKVPKRTVE